MVTDDFNLEDARIDQLPHGFPSKGDPLVFRNKKAGQTQQVPIDMFLPNLPVGNNNFEWIPNRKLPDGVTAYPYALHESVTKGGDWYQSLVDNNLSVPGNSDTWLKLTKSYSGGFWKAGVYTDDRPWVFSDHTGKTQIYELKDPTRPFISTNIVTEQAANKWVPMTSTKRVEVLDTSQPEILFDLNHEDEKTFRGSQNINGPRSWRIINNENILRYDFFFTVTTLDAHTLPLEVKMSNPLFNKGTRVWKPLDVGDYHLRASFDGIKFWYFRIDGPFGGGGNIMPTVFDNTISYNAGLLDGPRTYFDPEGDLENNPKPEVRTVSVTGTNKPGNLLTVNWTYFSPMGYVAGVHKYQWYRQNEDGTNREAIAGATANTYLVQELDVDKLINVDIIAVQVANAPANGNPESDPITSPGVFILSNIIVIPEMNLSDFYNHVFEKGTYDDVNGRWPDQGLGKAAGVYATNPTSGNRPVYSAVDQSLYFNPDVTQKWLEFNHDTGGTSRTHEMVGVAELESVNSLTKHIWAIASNISFREAPTNAFYASSSSTAAFTYPIVVPYKFRFRLRHSHNGTFAVLRLQLNYDEATNSFEFDETIVLSTGGAGFGAGTTRIGANKSTTPAQGWKGKIWLLAFKFQGHIPVENDINLWRRLNAAAGIA